MVFGLRSFLRLYEIWGVFAYYRIEKSFILPFWIRIFLYLHPIRYYKPYHYASLSRGERFYYILEALGPIFIKFGQLLSTRQDFIPEDITRALSKLQDQVTPFPTEIAQDCIEKAYKKPITQVFQYFETTPIAAASIAQVYRVFLWDGKKAALKIIRPGIEKIIERDLYWLYSIAYSLHQLFPRFHRFKLPQVIKQFEYTLKNELDLMREAANMSLLKRQFLHSPLLYIPEVYWEYSHPHLLVMEWIEGIAINNKIAIQAAGISFKLLAERAVEIFFTQVFQHSFFHADIHPGNIFISPHNPINPQYIAVDFGIMGTLSAIDQRYLAENMLAFFKRDYKRVATLHIESGWVHPDTSLEAFEADIRTICEPVFGKPLKEISYAHILLNLFAIASRYHMEVQPQLLLLQKTLFNIEGLGRELYPDLNLWDTAKPFLERWLRQQLGFKHFLKKIMQYSPHWFEKLPEIPHLMYANLRYKNQYYKTRTKLEEELKKTQRKLQRIKFYLFLTNILLLVIMIFLFFKYK